VVVGDGSRGGTGDGVCRWWCAARAVGLRLCKHSSVVVVGCWSVLASTDGNVAVHCCRAPVTTAKWRRSRNQLRGLV
jgi:hypothetical protein